MNKLSKFLCTCAGSNLEILAKNQEEIPKHNSIGATIVFTGLFASLSGGYAFYKIFDEFIIALLLGIIWGLMIFNLDRFIVMSMRKEGDFWKELLVAVPRIILAVMISLVIAKPLEVRIFSDRLQREIGDAQLDQMKEDREQLDSIFGVTTLKNEVFELDNQITEVRQLAAGEPQTPRYLALISRKENLETNSGQKAKEQTAAQTQITNFFRRYTYVDSSGGSTRRVKATRKEHLPPGAWDRIRPTVLKRDRLGREISAIGQEIEETKSDINAEKTRFNDEMENRIDELSQSRSTQDSLHNTAVVNKDSIVGDMDKINEASFSSNFITQLEALGELTKYKKSVYDDQGELVEEKSNTFYWINIAIIILFIVIETAPIFVKLISSMGPYDDAVLSKYLDKKSALLTLSNKRIAKRENREQLFVQNQEKIMKEQKAIFKKALKSLKRKHIKNMKNYKTLKDFKKGLKGVLDFKIK